MPETKLVAEVLMEETLGVFVGLDIMTCQEIDLELLNLRTGEWEVWPTKPRAV
jgi:hypothetical protein